MASAQSWEIEQIDTAQWGRPVLGLGRTSDLGLVVLYTDPAGGLVRIAWKNWAWQHEDVPLPSTSPYVSFSTSHAARAAIAIAYSDTQGFLGVAEDSCGQWRYRPSRISMSGPVLVQDTSGREIVYGVKDGAGNSTPIVRAVFSSVWLLDTVCPDTDCQVFDAQIDDHSVVSVLYQTIWTPAPYADLWIGTMTDTGWARRRTGGMQHSFIGPAAAAVDTAGEVQACCYTYDSYRPNGQCFWYNETVIDSYAFVCALAVDSLNRPHVVFTWPCASYPSLIYMYEDETHAWHRFAVTGVTMRSSSQFDIVLGDDRQPLIAFSSPEGIWLARGQGIVTAVEEREPRVPPGPVAATLGRGTVRVLRQSELFDADGRRVVELSPGLNNLGQVQAGVYFAREQGGVPTKVVLTK